MMARILLLSWLIWTTSVQTSKHMISSNYTIPESMENLGKINIEGYGSVYVVTRSSEGVELIGEQGFRISGGGGVYLATKDVDIGTDPFMYWQPTLADQVWSYDIDVSSVGCKCNAAMYFAMMPGYQGGEPFDGEWGVYYCDANFVNGNWCPEYDTFEGNLHSLQVALHTCEVEPTDPHEFTSCDRTGCATNACDAILGGYGPGNSVIDTTKPYRISHTQLIEGPDLVASLHLLSQEGRTARFSACNDFSYMSSFGPQLIGQVPVFSLWNMGCDETWLDGCTGCQDCCDLANASVTFTNFQLSPVQKEDMEEMRALYQTNN